MNTNNKNILYCSFCGKSQHEVRKLIAGLKFLLFWFWLQSITILLEIPVVSSIDSRNGQSQEGSIIGPGVDLSFLDGPGEDSTYILRAKMIDAIKQTSFENLKNLELTEGFKENPSTSPFFRNGKVGEWKKKLDKEQVQKIEKAFKIEMIELGYL